MLDGTCAHGDGFESYGCVNSISDLETVPSASPSFLLTFGVMLALRNVFSVSLTASRGAWVRVEVCEGMCLAL